MRLYASKAINVAHSIDEVMGSGVFEDIHTLYSSVIYFAIRKYTPYERIFSSVKDDS